MAKFDIQYADRPVNVQSTAAYARPQTQQYEAIAQAGSALFQIGEQEQQLKIYTEVENGKIALAEYDAETADMLQKTTDADEIQKISEDRLQQRSTLYESFATTRQSKSALDLYTRKSAVRQVEGMNAIRFNRQMEQAYIAYDVGYSKLAGEGGFKEMASVSEQAYKNGVIDGKEYTRRLKEIPKLEHNWNVEQVRELSQSLVTPDGDKTAAYEAIDEAQKNETITAKDNKILGDSLDNFVAGRIAKDQQAKYTYSVDRYRDYVSKMQGGNLTYEEVGNSKLSNADKNEWGVYIKRQFVKPPTESSYDGFNAASAIVFQANGLQINEKEAYRQLMDLRYGVQRDDEGNVEKEVDPKISESQYQWALDKIQNPLDADVLGDLQTVFEDIRKAYKGNFRFNKREQVQAQWANRHLFEWVDKRIKEGKSPTAQEMYAKARWYKSGAPAKYDLGDYEVRGGVVYVVVDFDKDGQPVFDIEKL